MKIFIDTADVQEIKKMNQLGVIHGVTTNPTLVAKANKNFFTLLKEIVEVIDGPISAEVISTDFEGMYKEAMELKKIHKNIVIKVPMIESGLQLVKRLSSEGIQTNVTLVFSAIQAMLAARAGATYVSPFVGRLDDIGQVGMDVIRDIRTIFDNYGFDTQILVASVRNPTHVLEAALIGADVATLPASVILQLAQHPLTTKGLEKFLNDWKSAQK